jgi:hypothetical protein
MLPGQVPLDVNNRTLLPGGNVISSSIINNPNIQRMLNNWGYRTAQSLIPGDQDVLKIRGGSRGYWENPYRIARYHDFIRSQPPDWQPPEWLNVPGVEAAYKYLNQRNEGKPWYEWKYLPPDDEATSFLQGLTNPPPEFLFPKEVAEINAKQKADEENLQAVGGWENLDPYQQTFQSLTTIQPINQTDTTGRPLGSKISANILRAIPAGVSGAGIGMVLASVGQLLLGTAVGAGVAAAAVPVGVIAAIGGIAFGLSAVYQNMTGKEVPVIGGMINAPGKVLSQLGSQPTEQVFGIVEQLIAGDEDTEQLLKEIPAMWTGGFARNARNAMQGNNKLPAMWKAGDINYETNERNKLMDAWVRGAIALGAKGADISDLAKKGEVYRWELGLSEPQKLPEGIKYGVEALRDASDKIEAGADQQQVLSEYRNAFGAQGNLNDFVFQSVADPWNIAPAVGAAFMHEAVGGPAFPKVKATNWVVDAMPFPVNMLAPIVSGGKWQGAPSVLSGIKKYKTFIQTGLMPGVDGVEADYKPPADYSNLEKTLGELDPETGMLKTFMPTDPNTKVPKFLSWLLNLTPDSKIRISQANLMDHFMRVMVDTANNDPKTMTRLVKTMSEVNPKMTGDALGAILNPAGEAPININKRFFNSPIGTALSVALKNIVEDGKIDELYLAKWQAPAQKRAFLWKAAQLMDITPGELLARLDSDTDVAGILKVKAQEAGIASYDTLTNAGLKDLLGVFTGENPLPIDPKLYLMELKNLVDDGLQDFMIKRFDLQQDSKFMRVAHVMKNVQSLLVLGLNPAYLINNAINNIITRSATGVLGFMTDAQISDLLKRNNIEPYRPDVGLKKFGLAAEYGINDIGEAEKISEVKRGNKDLINEAERLTGSGSLFKKVGVFSTISNALERSESRKAYTIAFRQMQGNLWQSGTGFRKLSPTIEIELDKIDPEIKTRLYDAVRNSANNEEIDTAVFDPRAPIKVEPLIDTLAQALADKHNIIVKDSAIYKELLVNNGIADELNTGLAKAQNLNDVDIVFDNAIAKSGEHARKLLSKEIDIRVEDVANRVKQGGVAEAVDLYTDMVLTYKKEWVRHFDEIEELQRNAINMDKGERNKAWRSQNAMDMMRFEDLNVWENATWKGIFGTLGKNSSEDVRNFIKVYEDTHKNWSDFYSKKNNRYNKLFDPDNNSKTWNADFEKANQDIADLAAKTYENEEALQLRADYLYIKIIESAGGDAQKAGIYRTAMRVIRQEMTDMMSKFRQELIDNPPESKIERNARWNQYIQEVYIPKISELKRIEIVGAQNTVPLEAAPAKYTDNVNQAFKDWKEDKVYWDGNNNFRLKDNKRAFPKWNAEVKNEFGIATIKSGMEDFHKAATEFYQGDTAKVAFGDNPESQIAIPLYQGKALSELANDYIVPMVDTLRGMYKNEFATGKKLALDGVPENLQAEVRKWINGVKSDMPATKLASMKYAEEMRDYALLNYKKQTGLDQALSTVVPYQFWYTHTMMNWAIRMLEKPNLYSWYYRYRQMQERMEKDGIPARLKGKARINAPYLPDWMGGGLWQDPMKQLFPFSQFLDPVDRIAQQENSAKYKAFDILDEMVKDGRVSKQEAESAKNTQTGAEWDQAFNAAMNESDLSDPMTLASMMMQPAMYITIPTLLAQGRAEKISPTPLLRYSKSLETTLSGTAFDALGKGIGLLGEPEKGLREKVMTPAQALFGEFGDYYIERNLTRMVADGMIGARDAKAAMIDKTGEAYDQAMERTKQELALRNPGILPLIAMKNGASIPQVAFSVMNSLYPAGILPAGEVEMIGKGPEYNAAWEKYKLGDKTALSTFFDENPEFEARSALRAKPEDRLHEYLVSEIWDRYTAADSANKKQINKQLGQNFYDTFLNKATHNYDGLSTETLAQWAHILGGYVPQTMEQPQTGTLDLWPADVTQAYKTYTDEKNQLFPNIYAIGQQYFKLPRSQQGGFLKRFPELKQYWAWKRDYTANNPIIAPILAANNYEATMETTTTGAVDMSKMDPTLVNQVQYSASTGSDLGPGAWMALQYQWEKSGKPYGDFQEWVDSEVLAQYK